MKAKALHILYVIFVSLPMLLCVIFSSGNLYELFEASLGHDTYFNQMNGVSYQEDVWYSAAYALAFLTVLCLGIYSLYKSKKKRLIILSVLAWLLVLAEIYTDTLFLDRV